MLDIISPNWDAPSSITAFTTTRLNGFSEAPFDSLNLGTNSGDDVECVLQNRQILSAAMRLPQEPTWLNQVHGSTVINAAKTESLVDADASHSSQANTVCAVLTADCLPILLCNTAGDEVAAIHAGWRSLAEGIIENTVAKLSSPSEQLMAWLGPAIGANDYEVSADVYDTFTQNNDAAKSAFTASTPEHWLTNLPLLATQRLQQLGITNISQCPFTTQAEPALFYSYRKEGQTGRMATLIYFS
jgi:YfiH family protein